mmetsp:Transcript_15063/g.38690  ORF Transcript_15063/g.38690 Transcript_15063/m.38690 type:complete len:1623 (+) Transcript_15063:291-5159(+)
MAAAGGGLRRSALDESRRRSIYAKRRSSREATGLVFTEGHTGAADDTGDDPSTGTDDHMVAADNVGTRDLATLAKLTEATIISELQLRYEKNVIYTNIGDILVAVNPFQVVLGLYSNEVSLEYFHDRDLNRIPHVFRVSQKAYKSVLLSHRHQCIVISGESGAGKTETAKFLVGHLLSMCKGEGTLEQKIMQVNPLLEAFGNARTVINDNSSRFGKYLDIKFGFFGEVLGASLSEYLLEKSRVVRQGDGERNFHVFYYLFSSCGEGSFKAKARLADITSYHYLRGGIARTTRDAVIDVNAKEMIESLGNLTQCMNDVGFTVTDVDSVFELLGAILHLGTFTFEESDTGFADLKCDDAIAPVSELLGVDPEELRMVLKSTSSVMRGERIFTNFSVSQSFDNRDAVAKAIYGRLFSWIVAQANELLAPRGHAYKDAKDREGGVTDVGILDIFGFENFTVNSFEQLCINVANEQLQFYFNQHIFAWELSTYAKEGIDVGAISYNDNRGLLDMILQKPLGVFALLDEESRFPTATAESFVAKVDTAAKQRGWENFNRCVSRSGTISRGETSKISYKKGDGAVAGPFFEILHFAGVVRYDSSQFLEKNRDTLSADVVRLLKASDNEFLGALFQTGQTRTGTYGTNKSRRRDVKSSKNSVSSHFKNSLLDLMDKMSSAQPHFVRCVKPNAAKKPGAFDREAVHKQLLYAGIVETTRIRRDGYAIRLKFTDFIEKYQTIGLKCYEVPSLDPKDPAPEEDLRVACAKIITAATLRDTLLGVSMVFLKYYHADTMMALIEKQHAASTRICTVARVWLAKRHLRKLRLEREQAIQAAKENAEREARERARQEQIERERAAAAEAERKAKEAVAAMAAKLEKQRQETMQRKKAKAEAEAAEAAIAKAEAEAKAAREAAERLEREAAAEAAKAQAEEDEMRRKREAAAAAEIAEREERKKQAADDFVRAQREAKLKNRMSSAEFLASVSNTPGAMDLAAAAGPADDEWTPDEDGFGTLLSDEDIDPYQRERLAAMAAKRRAEEERRRQVLAVLHAEEEQKAAEAHMRELNEIAEKERRLKDKKDAETAVNRAASAARVAALDFSFSWGDPEPTPAASAPAPPEEAQAAPAPPEPVVLRASHRKKGKTAVADKQRRSFLGSLLGSKKKSKSSITSDDSSTAGENGENPSNVTSPEKPDKSSRRFSTATKKRKKKLPEPVVSPPPPLPQPARVEPPPVAPKPSVRSSAAGAPAVAPKPSEPPTKQVADASNAAAGPGEAESPIEEVATATVSPSSNANVEPLQPPAAPAKGASVHAASTTEPEGDRIKCTLTKSESGTFGIGISSVPRTPYVKVSSLEARHGATGLCIGDIVAEVNGSAVTTSGHLVVLGLIRNSPTTLSLVVIRKQKMSVRRQPDPAEGSAAVAPPPAAAAPAEAEAPKKKPRRKLVRGGNAYVPKVLPEYQAALDAISDLDGFLDESESVDQELAAETELVTGSMKRTGTIRKRMESSVSVDSRRVPQSAEGVKALEDVLLLGGSAEAADPVAATADTKTKFVSAAVTLAPPRERTVSAIARRQDRESTSVDIKGYSLNVDDILSMDERERIALLERVKTGSMSIDDALQEVIEHKRRQNCAIM